MATDVALRPAARLTVKRAPRGETWAKVMLFALSLHIPGFGLVPLGALVALTGIRPAIRTLGSRSKLLRAFLPTAVLVLVVAVIMRFASGGFETRSTAVQAVEIGLWIVAFPLLGLGGGYALTLLGFKRGSLWVAAGALVGFGAYYNFGANPWKYVLGFPIGLTVLAVVGYRERRGFAIAAAVALAGVSFVESSRSLAGAFLLAALFLALPPLRSTRALLRRMVIIVLVSVAGFIVLTQAIGAGYFGQAEKTKYEMQTLRSGNILLGGRSEWAASLSLAGAHPAGFGLGVHPSPMLERDAIASAGDAGGDIGTGYYEQTVFNQRVDLHSMTADLWVNGGPVALLLVGLMMAILLQGAAAFSATRRVSAGAGLLAIGLAAWDLIFSPMQNLDEVGIALAFSIAAIHLFREPALRRSSPS